MKQNKMVKSDKSSDIVSITNTTEPSNASHAERFKKGLAAFKARDRATALKEWEPLADQGYARAQWRVGSLYYYGYGHDYGSSSIKRNDKFKGIKPDFKKAKKWFELAVEQGDANAQYELGRWYYLGENGVLQDYAEGERLLILAGKQGSIHAQSYLGYMYRRPKNLALPNFQKALKWYRLAAEQGDRESQDALARMYINGEGVPSDKIRAYLWLNILALKKNSKYSVRERDELANQLTTSEIYKAQAMAKECISSNYKNCGY